MNLGGAIYPIVDVGTVREPSAVRRTARISLRSLGEALVVEAHRVPDGVLGLVGVREVADVDFLTFEHLVVLEKAPELG